MNLQYLLKEICKVKMRLPLPIINDISITNASYNLSSGVTVAKRKKQTN